MDDPAMNSETRCINVPAHVRTLEDFEKWWKSPPDDWRDHAAPYIPQALEKDETGLCERCQGLHLEENLVARDGFFFEFEIDAAKMDSHCQFCTVLRSFTRGQQDLVYFSLHGNSYRIFQTSVRSNTMYTKTIRIHEQPWSANLWSRDRSTWPKNPEVVDLEYFKEIIAQCKDEHGETCCIQKRLPVDELRVFNCESRELEPATAETVYIALSYVWGNTLDSQSRRTIEDAKRITLMLGYKYIWVDQLCIDQESCHKMKQIQQMDRIYQNAVLTIIAAAGDNADYGIPGISLPRLRQTIGRLGDHALVESIARSSAGRVAENTVWNSRGWTMQEEMLSRRRLYFTDKIVFFTCPTGREPGVFETTPREFIPWFREIWERTRKQRSLQRPLPGIFSEATILERALLYSQLVSIYTRRSLSEPEDILNAFSGILRAFEKAECPLFNVKGIPIIPLLKTTKDGNTVLAQSVTPDSFVQGLKWIQQFRGQIIKRRAGDFPSWSWAGWNGEIYMSGCEGDFTDRNTGIGISIERTDGHVLSWSEFEQQSYLKEDPESISRFIHLDVWTLPITITPGAGQKFMATFELQCSGMYTSDNPGHDVVMNAWDGSSSKEFTGIIMCSLDCLHDGSLEPSMLLVEDKDGYAERVGCIRLEPDEPEFRKLKLERKRIRLG